MSEDAVNRGGRPVSVGSSMQISVLLDPARLEQLDHLMRRTQRSRSSLLREAIDALTKQYGETE